MDLSKRASKTKGYTYYNKIKFSLFQLIILVLLFQIKPTFAAHPEKDYISERAFFEDKTGKMSFQEVKGKNFEKINYALSKGYSSSVFWLRLKINPLVNSNFKSLLLRIQPNQIDSIQLFDSADTTNAKRFVGDHQSVNNNDYNSVNHNFLIPGLDKERYVWLKISTTGTNFLVVQALTIDEYIKKDLFQQIFYSFFIGSLFFLLIVPLTIWIKDKTTSNAIFVVKQFFVLTLVIVDTGIPRIIFHNANLEILNIIFCISLITYTAVLVGFHYFFLKEYYPKFWVKISFFIALTCYPIQIIEIFNKYYSVSLYINTIILSLIALVFLLIPFFGLSWKKISNPMFTRKFIAIFYFSNAFLILSTTLSKLGYLAGNEVNMMSVSFTGLITGILFLLILQYRNRMFREQRIREVAQANALANFERSKRQEKERFISMLTHELKTPLSILKLAYESGDVIKTDKHVEGALKDINDVIDRCALEDKLENQGFKLLIERHSLKRIVYQKISEYENADRFKLTIEGDLWIESDLNLLRIILGNLLDNAIKYGDENSPILINSRTENQNIKFTISNTIGEVGAPDEERLFTKYYRSEKAHKNTGSGLGLYLVSNLAKLLKGEAKYFLSSDQKLITFELTLPEKI